MKVPVTFKTLPLPELSIFYREAGDPQAPVDITTIAIESGFSSHSHLTACFHKHLGTCPSAFRKTVHFVAVRQGSDNS